MKNLSDLIYEAQGILSRAKTTDLGLDISEETLDEVSLKDLSDWFLRVQLIMADSPLWAEIEANSWIINGDRISRERIEKIISVLEIANDQNENESLPKVGFIK